MGWVLHLYQPTLKEKFKQWYDAKGTERKDIIDETAKAIQNIHGEVALVRQDLPPLPPDLKKVSICASVELKKSTIVSGNIKLVYQYAVKGKCSKE